MKTTRINRELILEEPEGGIYFGTDALLLAHFISSWRGGVGVDLGTGSGVIPLLLLSGGLKGMLTGIEIQELYCSNANRNAVINGFSDRFSVINGDIKDIKNLFASGGADAVFSNPPYLKTTSGKRSNTEQRNIAYHEVFCDINDICFAAAWCLRTGGRFYTVYRPERMAGLLSAMRNNRLEPKRIKLVFPSAGKPPSLILAEAKKDAREGLLFEPNLYIYTDGNHSEYSDEMKSIYREFE
ncbi:MAG: SAM-dependent methyltransferase [Firmicutes bacterium HGW-Firmicutes-21]|nr:MAG: SAM-dependent methyltransferase [Firmicutes bacterium HGW-Firmicutes-21]